MAAVDGRVSVPAVSQPIASQFAAAAAGPALGPIVGNTASLVAGDAVNAFRAQPNIAAGLGAATRELAVGPMSYGMEAIDNAISPVARAAGDFVGGMTGNTGRVGAGAPRARGVVTRAPEAPLPTGGAIDHAMVTQPAPPPGGSMPTYGDPSQGLRPGPITSSRDGAHVRIGDGSSIADVMNARPRNDSNIAWVSDPASGQVRQMSRAMLAARGGEAAARARDPSYQAHRRAYDAGTVTPSLMPIEKGPADPATEYLKMRNDGTWSGMLNATKYAKFLEGNRQAATGDLVAKTGARNADSADVVAQARMLEAKVAKLRGDGAAALTGEQVNESRQKQQANKIALDEARELEVLRRMAAQGDEKAAARYRTVMAAKQGKDPTTATNEKLLDAYIRSTAEFNKDPSNMGKQAPTFQGFLATLPPQMFPNIAQYLGSPAPLPPGAVRKVGTSGGRPVYQMRDGTQRIATQ